MDEKKWKLFDIQTLSVVRLILTKKRCLQYYQENENSSIDQDVIKYV